MFYALYVCSESEHNFDCKMKTGECVALSALRTTVIMGLDGASHNLDVVCNPNCLCAAQHKSLTFAIHRNTRCLNGNSLHLTCVASHTFMVYSFPKFLWTIFKSFFSVRVHLVTPLKSKFSQSGQMQTGARAAHAGSSHTYACHSVYSWAGGQK